MPCVILETNGSQRWVVGYPQNRIIHNIATHMLQKYHYSTSFGDPKVSYRDLKVGRDPT